jgi:hypothetical protein
MTVNLRRKYPHFQIKHFFWISFPNFKDFSDQHFINLFKLFHFLSFHSYQASAFVRKVADSGSWWLPSTWRSTRRPRWPTSTWSTLGRRASTWNLETAPDEVDSLIRKSLSHKELWKSLKLTSATNVS